MKKLLPALALLLAACHNKSGTAENGTIFTPPKPNTIVAADSMPVIEDKLNHQYFGVAIVATDSSTKGVYDIEAHYGYNLAVNTIKMPEGGEHFQPILRKGSEPYSYIIGFHFDNDTVFHEYFGITGQRGQMMMKYLKAYSMQ